MIDKNEFKTSKYLAGEDSYKSQGIKSYHSWYATLKFFTFFPKMVIKGGNLAKKGLYNSRAWINASIDIFFALENSGITFEIEGMKNIQKVNGPVVFISNHMSTLETVILPSIIHPVKYVTFIVKQELLKIPYFGLLLKARKPIVVGRTNPREDLINVLQTGNEYLKNGKSVIIFPQKTRSNYLELSSFNTLGVKLAKKADVPIIPVALVTDAWANGKFVKEVGKIDPEKKVYFSFGEPIKVTTAGAIEHQMVLDFIKAKFIQWGKRDLIKD
ncbi:MAG: 1-acyl-sn-glycerol-3-phosphate acyltransferase [Ignavibacteriales bacterium]|nr:MAG: 1-acyl-sn-glycerol-3-phosphate acyltransferase [Ignavibacteriales bacterium]